MKKCSIVSLKLKEGVKTFSDPENIWIVDKEIARLHSSLLRNLIKEKNQIWLVEGSEETKCFELYAKCCEYFLSLGIHRKNHLIALGGGVTSDFAGFVAATLLRGISWSVIPTTLLSMIDASIGGKTAINSNYGKNLIGSFHMPDGVYLDVSFLDTLPEEELQSGLGELLKYAFLDKEIYNSILGKEILDTIISKCALYKSSVVERDFKEMGDRKYLNFGHTLGHALEKRYGIPHGEAVFWGIFLILKVLESDLLIQFAKLSQKLNIKYKIPPWEKDGLDIPSLMQFASKDKKKMSSDMIEVIGVHSIGEPYIRKMTLKQIEEQLGKLKNEIDTFHL